MSVGKNVTKDPSAADLATLTRRVTDLERQLRQVPSRFPVVEQELGTIRVTQTAHGLARGNIVNRAQSGWSLFNPFVFFQLLEQDPAWTGALVGIVQETYGADELLVRFSGRYRGTWEFLDGANTEAPVAGAKLYANEDQLFFGELTHVPQPSGVVVGFMVNADEIVIAPYRDSDAVVVSILGSLSGGQVTLVTLDGVHAAASDVGADDTKQVGVAYLENATNILVAVAGTIRTDALNLIWADGVVWLDPDTDGAGVTTKPVVPVTEEWRPTRAARQINNRLTVHGGHLALGVNDLWDVDLTTPPASDDTLKWDDTDKRWRPGPGGLAGNADGPSVIARQVAGVGPVTAFMTTADEQVLFRSGGILQWDKIGVAQLKNTPAYTVLANGTSATAALTELAALDGTVFGRVGTDLKFGSNPQLGTAAAGLGSLKIHFLAGKYFEVSASGVVTFYHSATAQMSIDAAAKVTITYPNSNTVTFDSADFVGSSKAVKLREFDVCEAGVAKKILILSSAAY